MQKKEGRWKEVHHHERLKKVKRRRVEVNNQMHDEYEDATDSAKEEKG
jgi:hypothetical protein